MANVEKGRKGFQRRPVEERFWEKVDKREPDECWLWTGATAARRYGTLYVDGRNKRATHVSWELANGKPVPDGMVICHTCDNPPCVNPAHLWAGTMSENAKDAMRKGRLKLPEEPGWQAHVTQCRNGHPFTEENTIIRKEGWRQCRECHRIANRALREKKRAALQEKGE